MEKEDSDSTENTENFCNTGSRDLLADGIVNIFKPIVEKLDERIHGTRTAQIELKSQLEALSQSLREIEKAHHNIPEFSEKVKELINVKHKVSVIANILTTSQERLAALHKLIEREQSRRQALLDSAINTKFM